MRFSPATSVWSLSLVTLSSLSQLCKAIDLNVDDETSITQAAFVASHGLMNYYDGNLTGNIAGNWPQPYYWWEAGAAMGALIDYWFYTGDTAYNDVVTQAMIHQVGADNAFMPENQTSTEGNDDQGFWGIAAMGAAERGFPNPPSSQPQWLALAQGVFNSQAARWDPSHCGGGLRWQIFSFNNGYNYKNTISNGCFFHIAARLARYTGNQTYADWAEKTYKWTEDVGLITSDYKFYDGANVPGNCTSVDKIQWTYNVGIYLAGAAYMYNYTNGTNDFWTSRVSSILNGTDVFFNAGRGDIMYEAACEPYGKCNVDQRSFKGYLSRWMALTAVLAPFTQDKIMGRLKTSAKAASQNCIGGSDNTTCGFRWTEPGVWDGNFGVGEQMSALEVMQNLLATQKAGPLTATSGGTSQGDVNAGTGSSSTGSSSETLSKTTTGDRVGAGFLTTLCLAMLLGGTYWLII